jgi:transcriptional regulator with XRE-family HTH domain
MTKSFDKIKKSWQKDAEFQKEYDALDVEFALARSLIEARVRSGLTQEELADKMGTSQPTIARLESGHKPSLKTLERVAQVTGSKLMIQLVPEDAHPLNSNPNHALISFFKKL